MPTAITVLSQLVIVVVSFAMRLPAASIRARSVLDDRHACGAGRLGSIKPVSSTRAEGVQGARPANAMPWRSTMRIV
jgi:hypothetical protein